MLDCTAALKRLGVPRLVLTLDPGPLPEEILSDVVSQSPHQFPPGSMLEALLETFHECQALSETFTDLIEVLKLSNYLSNTPHYIPEYYKWFGWRSLVILHRLLSMPLHYKMSDKVDSGRIAAAFLARFVRLTCGRPASRIKVDL